MFSFEDLLDLECGRKETNYRVNGWSVEDDLPRIFDYTMALERLNIR